MGEGIPAQSQSAEQLCQRFCQLGQCGGVHGAQPLIIAPEYSADTAQQNCRGKHQHGQVCVRIFRHIAAKGLCQQQDCSGAQQSDQGEAVQGQPENPANPGVILQSRPLCGELCHCCGQPGNGQGVHRQEQPVGTAEIAHAAAPQQIGQGQLEYGTDNLGHQCGHQQHTGASQKALLFRNIPPLFPLFQGGLYRNSPPKLCELLKNCPPPGLSVHFMLPSWKLCDILNTIPRVRCSMKTD